MHGTDAQRAMARQLGVPEWTPEEKLEAARGFTQEEYEETALANELYEELLTGGAIRGTRIPAKVTG
jgi:hypothetical protein